MRSILSTAFVVLVACNGGTTPENDGSTKTAGSGGPAVCSDTAGARWTLEKSRFAFGGTPVLDGARWVGPHGVVALFSPEHAMSSMNSGAPESGRPDFSADSDALQAHVKEYLMGFGIEACQIADIQLMGSGGGGGPVGGPTTTFVGHTTISLNRAIDGIRVHDSMAYAQINDQDQAIQEAVNWPTLPAELVADAKALRDRLRDPAKLAEYRSKLTTDFRLSDDGEVTIHHPPSFNGEAQRFYVAYDANTIGSMGATISFDADGKRIAP